MNRWLVEEYIAPDPKRLKGVGLIPVQDPPAAVKELEYLAQQRGIVTAMLPTNVYGINLGHRMFDSVYAAAQEIGMGKKGLPIETFADNSIVDRLVREGFVDQLYKKR